MTLALIRYITIYIFFFSTDEGTLLSETSGYICIIIVLSLSVEKKMSNSSNWYYKLRHFKLCRGTRVSDDVIACELSEAAA